MSRQQQAGFALVEVLVAIAIAGLLIFMLGAYYPLASLSALRGRGHTIGASLGAQRMEQLRTRTVSWLTQGRVNSTFNVASGNPNCAGTPTEILNDLGTCYVSGVDTGTQFTRITSVTCMDNSAIPEPPSATQCASQPKLKKVTVKLWWPQQGAVCTVAGLESADRLCAVMSTILVDFP